MLCLSSKNNLSNQRVTLVIAFYILLQCLAVAETESAYSKDDNLVSDGLSLLKQGLSENLCTITFDDGPSKHTARLLDILKEYNVKATFFVVGRMVKRNPALIQRMIEEGHEVGNHSYSHNGLRHKSVEDQEGDLRKLDVLLRDLGANPRFVRPPFGAYDHNTVNVIRELDGHMVLWSIDSQDWRRQPNLDNMQSVSLGSALRGVFLFHDTHKATVDNMPIILEALVAGGCKFVPLEEYIYGPRNFTVEQPKQEDSVVAAQKDSIEPKLDESAPKLDIPLAIVQPSSVPLKIEKKVEEIIKPEAKQGKNVPQAAVVYANAS